MRAEAPEFAPAVLKGAGGGSAAAGNAPADEPDVLFEKGNPHIRTGRLEAEKLAESILTNRGALGKVSSQGFRSVMAKWQCHLSRKRRRGLLARPVARPTLSGSQTLWRSDA